MVAKIDNPSQLDMYKICRSKRYESNLGQGQE